MIKGTKDRPSVKSLKRVVTPGSSSSLITFANIVLMKTQQNARFAPVSIFVKKLVKRKNSFFTVTAIILLQVGGVTGKGLRKKLLKPQTVSTSHR